MPSTLKYSLSYPSGTSAPNVPLAMQYQAESVEAALNTFPFKMASGQGSISIGAGVASTSQVITLPAGFTVPPVVVLTNTSNVAGRASLLELYVNSTTSGQFTIKMQTSDNANIGTSYTIAYNWIAMQAASDSAVS